MTVVPASAPMPTLVSNTPSALAQTAAVVEGTVSGISTEYTPETGPWTRYTLSNVVVHRGVAPGGAISFVQQGGDYPDGTRLLVSTNPNFQLGGRYVAFLRNTGWTISPIVGKFAFRVESENGQEVLIDQSGSAVVDVTVSGIQASERLYEPVDLSGLPSRRNRTILPAGRAMSVRSLLTSIDAHLEISGLSIAGAFYNEPRTRNGLIPQVSAVGVPGWRGAQKTATDTADPTEPSN